MAYKLTVTCFGGTVVLSRTYETFDALSAAIDAAREEPGFVRYEVGPAGDE